MNSNTFIKNSGPAEQALMEAVGWLKLGIEMIGAGFVAVGAVAALVTLGKGLIQHQPAKFITTRLTFARYLGLALEFQLAADILTTAIAPSWPQIGKLAAIAVIRTALNYFLSHEMKEERREHKVEQQTTSS